MERLTGPNSTIETIQVAVGSIRRPKLDAVRDALSALAPRFPSLAAFDVVGVEVPSGVRHTPLTREEIMTGARRRAEALLRIARQNDEPWKYFVGLEGGIDVVQEGGVRWVFLQSWACVSDQAGQTSFGQSGAIPLPAALAKRVAEDGVELSEAIDLFAGATGIRDAQGAWGVLTGNLITRRDSFLVALISAFSPLLVGNAAGSIRSPAES